MCFGAGAAGDLQLNPFYKRNGHLAVEQWSRSIIDGLYVYSLELHRRYEAFARKPPSSHQEWGSIGNDGRQLSAVSLFYSILRIAAAKVT
jgi:hypothetical protein